jgi:hypothetical protein
MEEGGLMTRDELVKDLLQVTNLLFAERLADALEATLENIPALHVMSGGDVERRRETVKRKARAAFAKSFGRERARKRGHL